MRIYLGTYTTKTSHGIYRVELDPIAGKLSNPVLAVKTDQPSFLALHPNRKWVYACHEVDNMRPDRSGAIGGFAIDPTSGDLKPINRVTSGGGSPAHVEVDPSGSLAFAANYGTGSVAAIRIAADGTLSNSPQVFQDTGKGPMPDRQEGPHAHSVVCDPSGQFALACDLGNDTVYVYRLGGAALTEKSRLSVAPGSGPRVTTFNRTGEHVYLVNEMGNNVSLLHFDRASGTLEVVQTVSTLPVGINPGSNTAAAPALHPSGKWLFASSRGPDELVTYSIADDGQLTFVRRTPCGGKKPRHFAVDPSGHFLLCAHQDSASLTLFRIDPADASLKSLQTISLDQPVCVLFG